MAKVNLTVTTCSGIPELIKEAHECAEAHGFWENPPELGTALALIHGEISEALEEARSGHEPTVVYYREDGKPEGVPVELADTVIRIFDLCGYYGIDLEAAILEKMRFNWVRPRKHGKEF